MHEEIAIDPTYSFPMTKLSQEKEKGESRRQHGVGSRQYKYNPKRISGARMVKSNPGLVYKKTNIDRVQQCGIVPKDKGKVRSKDDEKCEAYPETFEPFLDGSLVIARVFFQILQVYFGDLLLGSKTTHRSAAGQSTTHLSVCLFARSLIICLSSFPPASYTITLEYLLDDLQLCLSQLIRPRLSVKYLLG